MHPDSSSHLTPTTPALAQRDERVPDAPGLDPLRLCVNTTIALISCILGPIALLFFSVLAISGYSRARQAGLMRSKCKLGDTRVVLAYLSTVAILALIAIPFWVLLWVRVIGS